MRIFTAVRFPTLFFQSPCSFFSSPNSDPVDPFSLVADELSIVANRLRAMVVTEVPKLASAAEYFFKMGVKGKRFRPIVASLLHDDVLDDADTRRGIGSLNFVMGNKISVLAGDLLLSRACVTLASLKNTKVVSLIATAVEHLVTGETMQMSISADQRSSTCIIIYCFSILTSKRIPYSRPGFHYQENK